MIARFLIVAVILTAAAAQAHDDATGYVDCLSADVQPPRDPADPDDSPELGLRNGCGFTVVARLCLQGDDGQWRIASDPVMLAPGQRRGWPDYTRGMLSYLGTACRPGPDCADTAGAHNPHCP